MVKNNLAAKEPQRVQEMDALIENFLAETKAVLPVPNPTFNPATYKIENEGRQKAKTNDKKTKAKTAAKQKAKADP